MPRSPSEGPEAGAGGQKAPREAATEVALIVGGGPGISASCARLFAGEGGLDCRSSGVDLKKRSSSGIAVRSLP